MVGICGAGCGLDPKHKRKLKLTPDLYMSPFIAHDMLAAFVFTAD